MCIFIVNVGVVSKYFTKDSLLFHREAFRFSNQFTSNLTDQRIGQRIGRESRTEAFKRTLLYYGKIYIIYSIVQSMFALVRQEPERAAATECQIDALLFHRNHLKRNVGGSFAKDAGQGSSSFGKINITTGSCRG